MWRAVLLLASLVIAGCAQSANRGDEVRGSFYGGVSGAVGAPDIRHRE
jgi:hypothetical protein